MANKIVLESATDILDNLRAKISTERYWLAGTIVGVVIGSLLPWEQVRVFSVFAGGAFAILICFEMFYSIRHEHSWNEARLLVYRRQNGLTSLPPVGPVIVYNEQKVSAASATVTIKHYDNPPTYEFLAFLFENANGGGQIPTERAIGEMGLKLGLWNTNQSDEWLTYTDEQHITEKMRQTKNGNAPRRIAEGMTLDEACKRFGLPPALPSSE